MSSSCLVYPMTNLYAPRVLTSDEYRRLSMLNGIAGTKRSVAASNTRVQGSPVTPAAHRLNSSALLLLTACLEPVDASLLLLEIG